MRELLRVVMCLSLGATAAAAQTAVIPQKLTLNEALRLAEERSPALAAARALVSAAEADVVGASQRPNPSLGFVSEGYAFGAGSNRPFLRDQEIELRVDQEIETAGRRGLRTEVATRSAEAARAALQDDVRRLRLEVQRAYFQVVLAGADRQAAQTSLKDIDTVIDVSRTRYRLGELSGGELRRLEVERLKFADDLFSADLALRNARGALLALLSAGRLDLSFDPVEPLGTPGGASRGGEVTPGSAPPALDVAALTAQALAARPDLAATRRDEDRATSEARLQRALRTPNVVAGAGFRRDFGDNGIIVEVSVPLPIFGRNPGGTARAEAERRLAASRVAAAEIAVSLEVQQAVNNVEVSRARVDYLEREFLKSARESRDIVVAAYRSGAADLSDYLDAERALREGQRVYNRALYDHRMHLFNLDAAVARSTGDPQQ